MEQKNLSNIQLELLKIYAQNIPEDELHEIKQLLAKYFAKRGVSEANKVWDNKKYTNEYMDKLLNELS